MVEHDTTESGTRTVNTFVFLLESAKASLDRANVLAPGDLSHSCLQAIVFSAFALEAYLNHIGP